MVKILKLINDHKITVILALLTGIIYVAPNLIFAGQKNYKGIQLMNLDAEVFYSARIKEVIEGHKDYTSTYFYEYKDGKESIYQYIDIAVGMFLRYVKIDLVSFFTYSKFVFTIISFQLWYYFSYLISKRKLVGILSAVLLFLGYHLFDVPNVINQFKIIFFKSGDLSPLVFGRFPSPLLTYPFFILGLIFAFLFFKESTKKHAMVLGLLASLNLYLYAFFGVYLLALIFIILIYFIIRNNRESLKNFIYLTLTALIASGYYIYYLFKVMFLGSINNATAGSYSVYSLSHRPLMPKVLIIGFLMMAVYLLYCKYRSLKPAKEKIFLIILLFTSAFSLNQQIITGKLVEDGHFHWYINKPIFYLVFCILFVWFFELLANKKLLKLYLLKLIFSFFVIYSIFLGIGVQASSYKNSYNEYANQQKYRPFIDWLNNNSQPESVVLANQKLSLLIPVYTHNNIYYVRSYPIHFSTYSLDRRINSVCLSLYLEKGESAKEEIYNLAEIQNIYGSYIYFNYYQNRMPQDLVEKIINKCNEYYQNPIRTNLGQYRLDYIIFDKDEDKNWPIQSFDFIEPIYKYENIVLYKVIF